MIIPYDILSFFRSNLYLLTYDDLFNALYDKYALPDLYKFFYYITYCIYTYPVDEIDLVILKNEGKKEIPNIKLGGTKATKLKEFVAQQIAKIKMSKKNEESVKKKKVKKE